MLNILSLKKKYNMENTKDIYTQIGCNIDTFLENDNYKSMDSKYHLTEFFDIIQDIISNDTVQKMKEYRQHCNTSCFKHCMQVSYFTFIACKALKLDYISAARAAMLHDLFLFDRRKKYRDVELPGLHAFTHPLIALKNANKIFYLNEKEKDIIAKHMWPVTFSFPRFKESYIVTIMDKYSACLESYLYIQDKLKKKSFYKTAYIFLSLILFRIV